MHTAVGASAFLSLDGAIIESLREIKWPPLRQAVNFSSYLSIELLQYRECEDGGAVRGILWGSLGTREIRGRPLQMRY